MTATKRGKVENLRVKELSAAGETSTVQLANMSETRIPPRVSGGQVSTLSRAASADSLSTSNKVADNRDSAISTTSTIPAKTKAEAVLRTMRSLEGTRRVERVKSRDVLAAIKRPAPSPPRPRSLDSQVEAESRKTKEEQRRSLGVERKLADLTEESPPKANAVIGRSTCTFGTDCSHVSAEAGSSRITCAKITGQDCTSPINGVTAPTS